MWSIASGNNRFLVVGKEQVFKFTESPQRVVVLTEESQDPDTWSEPLVVWEHIVKSPKFSAHVCRGRGNCSMCRENDNVVGGNKDKPFPVRKRYVFPVLVGGQVILAMVSEELARDIASYMSRVPSGHCAEFDFYRIGSGVATRYRAVWIGVTKRPDVQVKSPRAIDLFDDSTLIRETDTVAPQVVSVNAGQLELDFGPYAGQSVSQVLDKDRRYIEELASRSAGAFKAKLEALLAQNNPTKA